MLNPLYLPLFIFLYAAALILYRLTLHPLAKFPGPKIAAATKWFEFYYDCVKGGGGLFSHEIDRMHERYGPIVRINPHEIHVSDGAWLDTLYPGPGPVRDKYAPSAHMSGVPQGTFGTVDHYIHRQRRAAVKTFVSKKTVQTVQPSIRSTVELLCREFNRFATSRETFECGTFFLAWATDSVAKYLENDTYGLLENAHRRREWQETISQVVELTPLVKQFPSFMPFVLRVPGWLMRVVSPKMNRVLVMHKRMRSTARQYLNLHTAAEKLADAPAGDSSHPSGAKVDAYRAILTSTLPDIDKEPDRVAQEVLTLLVGGSATTMRVMLRVVYHVNSTPGVLGRLTETLDAVMTTPTASSELEVLEKQEYLVAVVKESLRIATALTARLPLVSPSKPLVYTNSDGTEWVIPAGTPTSMSISRIHMDPTIYADPYSFRPERWLGTPADGASLEKNLVPFGRGARMCVGQNFAWAELLICTAILFRRFAFELVDVDRARDIDVQRDCFLGQPSRESRGLRVKVRTRG
ncbi:MAG: hypothetical protein LQ339_007589 [Xanthoria mediterranea]|nr:MAG: hypothetical protein LQ339_007589 [Xanthoria mediterranea]